MFFKTLINLFQVCNFEFGDNDYGLDNIVYDSATVYYKDMQTQGVRKRKIHANSVANFRENCKNPCYVRL